MDRFSVISKLLYSLLFQQIFLKRHLVSATVIIEDKAIRSLSTGKKPGCYHPRACYYEIECQKHL